MNNLETNDVCLKSSRTVSCFVAIHTTGIPKERNLTAGGMKTVTNVKVKAGSVNAELGAWGDHAEVLGNAQVDAVYRLDAVLAIADPQQDGTRSVKLTTLDCTKITLADPDDAAAILAPRRCRAFGLMVNNQYTGRKHIPLHSDADELCASTARSCL